MKYDSLLLECGGGIHGKANKSAQYEGSAALIIGLGGTGVAALSTLKGKIREQLHSDDPKDFTKYDGIQLLGIDSDETDYKRYKGNCRLTENEFLSICNPSLAAILKEKTPVKNDPFFNWMEIDKIDALLSPDGAGGIRQVGRYLLMNKIGELYESIYTKATLAMEKRKSSNLDVYIFAGISGGTGSGCFLDTCYIVRQIAEDNKWKAKIMGYFFLPDVVTSKKQVATVESSREYNQSNGYAAMKELDYLMSLSAAGDRFVQDYSATVKVDTKEPPADMCHLVSAMRADGTPMPNGFDYAINVASDYVMSYLADVDLEGGAKGEDNGVTMRGHAANIVKGVSMLKKQYGANLSYHIMGARNAEIPMTQINTYLACGFYEKFMKAVNGGTIAVTKADVTNFVKLLKLACDDVSDKLDRDCPAFELPNMDPRSLQGTSKPAPGKLNENWAISANEWLDNCKGRLTGNGNGLLVEIDNYAYDSINPDSLIGSVLRKLLDYARDPQFGPYYAAQILRNGAYSLDSAIDDAIKAAEEKLATWNMYLKGSKEDMEAAKDEFYSSGALSRNKTYQRYREMIRRYYDNLYQIDRFTKTAEVFRSFRKQSSELHEGFFKPFLEMLDSLRETFEENQVYLNLPTAKGVSDYTWQIFTFQDIKAKLDERIDLLTAKELIVDFVDGLLKNPDEWLGGEADRIALQIREQMLTLFDKESKRSLQEYLFERYPQADGDAQKLADIVEEEIIKKVHTDSIPMFRCDPTFSLQNTFITSNLSVPRDASAVCQAAKAYKEHSKSANFTVRKTGLGNRIFSLRLYSGVPLYAYQGIEEQKKVYDRYSGASHAAFAGIHLYTNTGRKDARGNVSPEWKGFLPTPMPYSKKKELVPEGEECLKLYDKAVAAGVIKQYEDGDWYLHKTPDYATKGYKLDTFMVEGQFSMPLYEKEYAAMTTLLADLYKDCEKIVLNNDGDITKGEDVVTRVRTDYFIHYPKLQQIARAELAKREAIQADLETLSDVKAAYELYEKEMDRYCAAIFYKLVTCCDNMEQEEYDKIFNIFYIYKNQFGDDKKFDFSARVETMKFAKDYPLYQGFLTYRGLKLDEVPRQELDEKIAEAEQRKKVFEDFMIPAILELIWDGKAMDALAKEVSNMSPAEAAEIIRFYDGLRSRINQLKADTNRWPTMDEMKAYKSGEAPATSEPAPVPDTTMAPPPPPAREYWWVYDPNTGKQLVVYRQYGPTQAYDQQTQTWHPVHSGMQVTTPDDKAWIPLKDDPFFADIK